MRREFPLAPKGGIRNSVLDIIYNKMVVNSSPLGRLGGEEIAIYLHIPFCKQACYYCDFHFSTSLKRKDEMLQALIAELVLRKDELKNKMVETIYFGGGTPSLLTIAELQLLLDTVYKNYTVIDKPEITLEANPDDLMLVQDVTLSLPVRQTGAVEMKSNNIFELYKKIGINRLSIGIQSFFDDDLKDMNRAHSAKEAREVLSMATRHFDNITIDLIYGIPTMTDERWKENLQIAFDFGVHHISSYALTVEPKTALDTFIKKGKYPPIDEEKALAHFEILVKETKKQGFVHYEISNFGKPDCFSKHNTSYWLGKSYLGIGPSAHSYNGTHRSWNVANNSKYIKAIQEYRLPYEIEKLSMNDQFNEAVMTGLRTIWGVSLADIATRFSVAYKNELLDNAKEFIDKGLLEIVTSNKIEKLVITNKGKFLSDGIASSLFRI